jgi:hypothetical protein
VGPPGAGARLKDLETIAMALAKKGIVFEPRNPVTFLFQDIKAGGLKPELKEEKVLSTMIEFELQPHQLRGVLQPLRDVSAERDTVFFVGLISFPEKREGPSS